MPNGLQEIRKWKLEAKFEDMERYFYEFPDVDRLIAGDIFFVIGRKGAGKTALSEHIKNLNSYNVFCEWLIPLAPVAL
jgi:ABC-type methionine transport system ATPase subunit